MVANLYPPLMVSGLIQACISKCMRDTGCKHCFIPLVSAEFRHEVECLRSKHPWLNGSPTCFGNPPGHESGCTKRKCRYYDDCLEVFAERLTVMVRGERDG